ncbi:MAG: hypothetical protein JXA15_10975 [Spirochaetales bacterium]|nr:hypothetical protein [Spirochaetales bacterium]
MSDRIDPSRCHSGRDPFAEACRFLEAKSAGRRPSSLVSIAPAQDWLALAAERLWPGITIVSLQPDPGFRGTEVPSSAIRWYPDSPRCIRDFLAGTLEGSMDGGILVAEWRPALARYPGFATAAGTELAEALRFLSSARNSERYWARRWLLNSCRNFLRLDSVSVIRRDARPVLLAGAGPGLESALDELSELRGRLRVWTLASAAEACVVRGFHPELLFASDAGAWSLLHFRFPEALPVVAPIHAKLPAGMVERGNLVPAELGIFHDAPLLAALGAEAVPLAPHGTAAGSAASLAAWSGATAVVMAGVDFAALDLRDHARPYAFDALDRSGESRLKPSHSAVFSRVTTHYPSRTVGRWRVSRAFEAYSGAGLPCAAALTLSASPASPFSIPRIDAAEARSLLAPAPESNASIHGPFPTRLTRSERENLLPGLLGRLAESVATALERLEPGARLPDPIRQGLEAFCGAASSEWLAERARGANTPSLTAATAALAREAPRELLEELLG